MGLAEGDWSIVFMNADAASGVAVDGDASAELPILPWVAVGLLLVGAASGFIGGWLLLSGARAPSGTIRHRAVATNFNLGGRRGTQQRGRERMSQQATSFDREDRGAGRAPHRQGQGADPRGNVQRIVINDADGKPVLDMPVTVGVIGLLVAPSITAIGTLGALRRTTRSTSSGSTPRPQNRVSSRSRARATWKRRGVHAGELQESPGALCRAVQRG